MKRSRKHFTAQEKMALLRRHFVEKVAVSTLCDEAKVQVLTLSALADRLEHGEAVPEYLNVTLLAA